MAVDKRVEADLNLNEAKFEVEGDPLEIKKPETRRTNNRIYRRWSGKHATFYGWRKSWRRS